MNYCHINTPEMYQEREMSKSACLICGENCENNNYRGKSVCSKCLDFIRSNY